MNMLRFFLVVCFSLVGLKAEDTCFTIFSFNDTYSIFQRKQFSDLPQIMTLLEKEKQKVQQTITLMNGEIEPCDDIANSLMDVISQMGVDYICVSQGFLKNHKASEKSKLQYLAANCIGKDNLPIAKAKQSQVFIVNGIKIGLFGLIDTVDEKEGDILCVSPFFTAKQKVAELKKQGVDVIVVVTQLKNGQDRNLAQNIPEIDVIIGCSENDPISWFEGKTFIHQTSLKEPHITRIDIHIQKKNSPWRADIEVLPTWRLIVNEQVDPDINISKIIEELNQKLFLTQ